MKIIIVSVGGKHDSQLHASIAEYTKRLGRHYEIEWKLLPHSHSDQETIKRKESDMIISAIDDSSLLWLLDETGQQLNSVELSARLDSLKMSTKNLYVIIGGAYGVDERVRKRANFVWSLSRLVFPHQLVRLILMEQLYRADSILRGTGYHHK